MIEIDKRLHQDIREYCKLNGLVMKDFVNKLLKKAFTIEKYGDKPFSEPKMSNLELEAIEKIKDMVECQVDLPIEIAEAMEEVDFFELLGEEKNDNTRISITANNENRERVNKTQTTDTLSSTEEKEKIKVVRKKKRKLS